MKNLIIAFLLTPLFLMAQNDTIFYWYSAKQLKLTESTLYAPNGVQYSCMSYVPDGTKCGNFDDMKLVCKTIRGVVVFNTIGDPDLYGMGNDGRGKTESFYVPKSKVHQAAGYLFFFEDEIIFSEISKEMSDTCILLSMNGLCVNCETILPIREQYDVIEAGWRLVLASQIENRDRRYIWMAKASSYDGDFLKFYDLTH